MSDVVAALQGAVYDGFAKVEAAGPRGMITVKGDLAASVLKNATTGVAGVDFPGQGEANCVGEKGICWMAPDEVLVLVPYAEVPDAVGRMEKVLAGTHHLIANVSDARALFFVSGLDAREVIAKLTPADVSPSAFRPGQFRRTRLAQVPAAFWMRDAETFEVICFRSVARYVFDLLKTAALPGSEVGYF
ncbi:MAG: sarcosine oxidase subunit gamma family protein [Rhodobacter sp.]|nr:sarcosine oxidase subunit gamma family protein [Rhodobacter sp.]